MKNHKKEFHSPTSTTFIVNSNMTWFFSPIKSTDTNSALLAR